MRRAMHATLGGKLITATVLLAAIALTPAMAQGKAKATAQPGQLGRVMTIGIDGSDPRLVCEAEGIQAPNWTPDGKWLVCNGIIAGSKVLLRVAADGSTQPELIPTGTMKVASNDHVLSPDGKTIYFTVNPHLYAVPFAGGTPRRISNEHPAATAFKYFLHGVSPDNKTLAYVGVSAVGKWIYFNSELNAKVPGHSQCYRMKSDGSGIEQLTHDERVNWFPHISPDGKWIVYLSYPPGTLKHPANKAVILRRMRPDGSEQADIIAFNGGQGTINVNSWAPDSRRFAYVDYPVQPAASSK